MLGPIFAREWLTVPRRSRHYVTRVVYLGVLWVLGLTAWQATIGWGSVATVGDWARFGVLLFQILTYLQLVLLLFFAALSSVSAITQEKDRRTFLLLLITDLRNHEIVLGKLFGSLLPVFILLAAAVPLLALLMLLGGVAEWQVLEATLVLAATTLAAGSLGGLLALWRDKTFQALALTFLCLVLYLCLVQGLAAVPALLDLIPWPSGQSPAFDVEAWQAWLGPFQALQAVLEPPDSSVHALPPAYGYAALMVLFSVLLNLWGILRLRVWNPSGEPIQQREAPGEETEEKDRLRAHAAPGPVRQVWANPILWREIATRAYGRRPLLIKLAYLIVFGLVCYYSLGPLWTNSDRPPFAAAVGLVPIGILGLLLVSAQAVTSITSERDTGALDLLLVTDLTPKEFIFGKLGGICWNAALYILPLLVLAGVYAGFGWLATPPRSRPDLLAARNVESLAAIVLGALVLMGFAMVLGLHVALRTPNSRLAIVHTLGTVFFLSVGTLVCIELILINGQFEYQWLSFIFFLAGGIGGLWWVLSGDRPSPALTIASWLCPLAMYYSVTTIIIAKPGTNESADPLIPFLVIAGGFGFAIVAMLVPLLSEFDIALGRTTGAGE